MWHHVFCSGGLVKEMMESGSGSCRKAGPVHCCSPASSGLRCGMKVRTHLAHLQKNIGIVTLFATVLLNDGNCHGQAVAYTSLEESLAQDLRKLLNVLLLRHINNTQYLITIRDS